MKVLFVSSGNSIEWISPIIKNQAESLIHQGIQLYFFTIRGRGVKGYLKAIIALKKHLKHKKYDVVHAHYSLSGYVASFAGAKPLVVSLMGSDVKVKSYSRFVIELFNLFFWSKILVKSKDMKRTIDLKEALIIPNGVNFNEFKTIDKNIALKKTNWDSTKKHILFAANPNRPEKNFKLGKEAFDLLDSNEIELHYLENIPNNKMINYYNSSDVVLLTSLWEGSPNVIKEAMACNIPIVSTDVGDVKEVIGNTRGCYLTKNDPENISVKIKEALNFNGKTTGSCNIKYLDSKVIASKIIKIYSSILKNKL